MLSIIVPIYNVASYLRKCVGSILEQDYSDYEIILVDDGSTDKCPQICDEYAQKSKEIRVHCQEYPLIRVIHRENGGLSAARNSGINVAQGEYVMFVDSDDYLEPNVLGVLMEQLKREQLDVLRFNYQNVRVKSERVTELVNEQEYVVFEPNKQPHCIDQRHEVVDGEMYLNTRMGYACYAWQFIIRKTIVNSFTPGIHFEDVDWLPRMLMKAQRVNVTAKPVYNYFWREGSITLTQGNKDKVKKNVEDFLYVIKKYNGYIAQYPQCSWLRNMQSSMVAGVLSIIARQFYIEHKYFIQRLKMMNVFPLRIADQGTTYKRRALLANLLGAELYCRLMHLRK